LYDLSAGIVGSSGSFLRLVYGGSLRFATRVHLERRRPMADRPMATTATVDKIDRESDGELRGRPQRADAQRNYERLVAAARGAFAQEGGGASMETIAKEAGVGIGTLYRHFPKRIDVVEAVYREDVDELVDAAESFVEDLEPWSALEAWLEAFVRYAIGKRRFLNELHEAFEKNPELRIVSRERIEQALSIVLTSAQAAGMVRTDLDGPDLMQLLGSMCMSATLTPEQSARLLTMIEDGLRPPK
jgi:AcrR family transcriptional regulator